ncbi:MAG: leucine--tRNA ligase, partial [Chloroflexota bacterium]
MFDWSREVVTCDPNYYQWNQWFFLQFFKAGLAYKKMAPVDWCPKDQTVLAREQVWGVDRHCERCGTPVIKKDLEQWFFRITKYADELLDFSKMEWSERVQTLQTNWIGRSEGAEIQFRVVSPESHASHRENSALSTQHSLTCFSTRPDTLFGATFIVLAPEHPLVAQVTTPERNAEVDAYIFEARRKTEIDREATDQQKTGVFIGAYAENPLNGAHIPIWIADYVLMGYGTGAIMGVPAHDARDWEFAQQFDLPILTVIAPDAWDGMPLQAVYVGEGVMVNSGEFNGTSSVEGKRKVAQKLEAMGAGKAAVTYRIRDWLISRQRYWGTPIPIIYCDEHGIVPVPEKDLPVVLPVDDSIKFNPQGQSPLLFREDFLKTICPICGKPARRETDTMDGFMDNSWYQYAYLSPYKIDAPFDRALADQWMPVDQYTGGIEHATMHLLYTRFFTKAMRDTTGLTEDNEPMKRLFNQGIILSPAERPGERAQKMSKSKGKVISPDALVAKYGADTVRAFLMFIGPWDQGGPWDDSGIDGVRKWINRVWTLAVERSN